MSEERRVVDSRGRSRTVSKVPLQEAGEEVLRFWYEGLTPEQRVDAVAEVLESCRKARAHHAIPIPRRVHRRSRLQGDKWLMYGAGLRLMECLRLRVQDIDFDRHEIMVRDGNGAKDRRTMLPNSLTSPLREHLRTVKAIHEPDLADGWGRVLMPEVTDRRRAVDAVKVL